MPKVRIDDNSHEILKVVKADMRSEGICASFSDAIRRMYEVSSMVVCDGTDE